MKTVLLIRHAKSSWEDITIDDFDRPLNDRGKHDAPEMAKRLLKRKQAIDAFISSPAKRARKTALIFAEEYKFDKDKVKFHDYLYHASTENFNKAIASAPDRADNIAIFSHNPGITAYANELTDVKVDDMPTCAIFAVIADIRHWKDFENADRKFLFFDYPKANQ